MDANAIPYVPQPAHEVERIRAHIDRHIAEQNRRDYTRLLALFQPPDEPVSLNQSQGDSP